MAILIIAGLLISPPLMIEEEITYFDKEKLLSKEKPEIMSKNK